MTPDIISRESCILNPRKGNFVSAEEAVKAIKSGDRVYIGGGCAAPQSLIKAMVARSSELNNVEVVHILTAGPAPYTDPRYQGIFKSRNFFMGGNVRKAVQEGRADYIPIFLSKIPSLFLEGQMPLDVALITVSPPDKHGFCSFSIETGVTKPAAEAAKIVIAQINDQMPRCYGDCFIHIDDIDYSVRISEPLIDLPQSEPSDLHKEIGKHVAELIHDGSTLQVGIGGIPDGLLYCLKDKNDLGVHTEMFSDGIIDLIEAGNINNKKKQTHKGKVVAGFALGSRRLFDYMHDNPIFAMFPTHYVNDIINIAKNDNMVSVNSAIEVDLTGQVCADSIGTKFYSGIGGQVDYVRGATLSKGGKAIIALPSTTKNDTISKIVPVLKLGAGVVTSRGDVDHIATEYGVAFLRGKSISERAEALINIAHPKFREELRTRAKEFKFI